MDVFPATRGPIAALLLCCAFLTACGNRFDLATERGRQSRIDGANIHLSKGECAQALDSILPLYQSSFVDDEVRLVTASAYACAGTFNMLTLLGSIANASNPFQAIAKAMANKPNDGARAAMYQAIDVLTRNEALLSAAQRAPEVNTYMVFLQFGVIGAVIRNYGSPALDGSQGSNLVYDVASNPAGEMSNVDACALAGSLATIVDSFAYSSLTDPDTRSISDQLENVCQTYTGQSCTVLGKQRSVCDGTNTASQVAMLVVAGVNATW